MIRALFRLMHPQVSIRLTEGIIVATITGITAIVEAAIVEVAITEAVMVEVAMIVITATDTAAIKRRSAL